MHPSEIARLIVDYDPHLRRLYVCGQRVHHGAAGLFLLAAGAVLVAHDWKDRPWTR